MPFKASLRYKTNTADIYLFKVNSGNKKAIFQMCSKLAIKTAELYQFTTF